MDKYSNTWGIGDVIKMSKLAARSGAACCQRCRSCPLMTIISLRTERSDPVAPHGAGVSLSLCVCVHIKLCWVSQLVFIDLNKKSRPFAAAHAQPSTSALTAVLTSLQITVICLFIYLFLWLTLNRRQASEFNWNLTEREFKCKKCIWDLQVNSVICFRRPLQTGVSDAKLKLNGIMLQSMQTAPMQVRPEGTFCLSAGATVMFFDWNIS